MALKPLNSVGGFSVGEIPTTIILANGDITTVNGTFTGNVIIGNVQVNTLANLGQVGNVKIYGGSPNQYLQTDGFGNLTWTTADTSRIANGTSNVAIPVGSGNVNTSVGGIANVLVVTQTGANIAGTLNATGNANVGNLGAAEGVFTANITSLNANLGNLIVANYANLAANLTANNANINVQLYGNAANFSGNVGMDKWLTVSNTANVGNLRTDNLLHANGTPWDFATAAGSNTWVQYSNGTDLDASANFTYDDAAQQLYLNGNANVTGTTKTYQEQLTSLTSTQVVYGNGSSFLVGSANFTFNDTTNTLVVPNANIAGNLNGGIANFTGNLTALNANLGNLAIANYINVAANLVVTDTANVGNLKVVSNVVTDLTPNANLTLNLGTGTQRWNNAYLGNINGSGNLAVLNANLGNLATANYVTVASNTTTNNLTVNLQLDGDTANFTGNVQMDQWLTVSDTANVGNLRTDHLLYANGQPWDLQEAAGANYQIQYNIGNNFAASANFTYNDGTQQFKVIGSGNITSELVVGGNANVTGNVTAANFSTTGSGGNISGANVVSANTISVINAQVTSLTSARIPFANNSNYLVDSANLTFNSGTQTLVVTGNANVSGTVNTPNVDSGGSSTDLTLSANGYSVTLSASNGNVDFPGNVIATTFYGNVNGNFTTSAANTSVLFSDGGLIAGATNFTFNKTSNLFTTPGNITVNGNALVTGNANFAGNTVSISNYSVSGNGSGLALVDNGIGVEIAWNASSFAYVDANGVSLEANGFFANLDNSGNFSLPNNLSVFGNIANVNNISVTNNVNAVIGNFSGNINSLNANLGNLALANYVNVASNLVTSNANVTTQLIAANANVTSNLVASNANITTQLEAAAANFSGNVNFNGANVTVNSYLTGNIANFSGNITSLNATLGNLADANYVRTQQLFNGSANIDINPSGNIAFSPTVGNVMVVSSGGANITGFLTVSGNGTFDALYSNTLTAQGGNLTLYSEQSGNTNVILHPYGTGTVDVNSARITSLGTPNAASDAATKAYVDSVAQGLDVKDSVHAASYAPIANNYTYNNGTGGVGATLTANQNGILQLDGQTILLGERVLIKNEVGAYVNNTTPSAAFNGIYVCTTEGTAGAAWVLTRAVDFDAASEMYGAFTFIETGNNQADTGWVCTNNKANPITVGTTEILWTQFSGAGTYSAGAGLTLTGTQFSVNVDNDTTEIYAGNVVVKAGGNLYQPNINDGTFSSLIWNSSGNGNVSGNNLNATELVTAGNIQVTGNVLAGNLLANSNVTSNNATVNLELSGNTANFIGAVIMNSANVNLALNGNTANFTGNLTSLNANLGNLALANYVNVAANLVTSNANVTTMLIAAAANVTGNLMASNANVTLNFDANVANFSGNVRFDGSNVTVNSYLSGNIANFTGNLTAANANLGNLVTANYFTGTLVNGTSNAGIDGVSGNFNVSVAGTANVVQITSSNANVTGNVNVTGNIAANNFTANIITADVRANIGPTQIVYGNVTTNSITANQAIASVSITGVTGVEWLVKGYDSAGSKYSMSVVTAVTDGTSADYSTFGTVYLGAPTGSLAVNINGSNLELQVTPASSNSTVWVTQFRTI